jgi:isoquinoline 1-oxidoreductase beta subunit
MTIALSRREFLKVSMAAGGGLALEFSFPVVSAMTGEAVATEVNAWIVIHPDDRVVIRIAR